jgi:hypothetical protein
MSSIVAHKYIKVSAQPPLSFRTQTRPVLPLLLLPAHGPVHRHQVPQHPLRRLALPTQTGFEQRQRR